MRSDLEDAHGLLPAGYRLEIRQETGSTNDDIRQLGQRAEPAGRVIAAERQLAGRGRRGAAWVCPPGLGLAFSVLLRPTIHKALWPRLSLATGIAVAEALESFGIMAELKWPNDIWIAGKKISGILVEAGEDFVIVGIGLNVGVMDFPDELRTSATSLCLECGEAPSRGQVLARITAKLDAWQHAIDADFPALLRAYRLRCALTGRRVQLWSAGELLTGEVSGIGDGGELLLRDETGTRKIVQADEVRPLSD
jgi:BirA family transcriptional regulator, biotin operon repressor / biotin---[acetyl-CoA-carboxylase] ligase